MVLKQSEGIREKVRPQCFETEDTVTKWKLITPVDVAVEKK